MKLTNQLKKTEKFYVLRVCLNRLQSDYKAGQTIAMTWIKGFFDPLKDYSLFPIEVQCITLKFSR